MLLRRLGDELMARLRFYSDKQGGFSGGARRREGKKLVEPLSELSIKSPQFINVDH